jgi:two-component system sensor histidine kinase TctE
MANDSALLRSQLLKFLLPPLLLLLIADSFVSYWVALSFAERAYDVALVEIVREVSLHVRQAESGLDFDMPEAARRVLFSDPVDTLYYQVAAPDGRLIAGHPLPAPERASYRDHHLYDARIEDETIRLVQLHVAPEGASAAGAVLVRVAETKNKRNALAREILLSVVVPQVLLILIACAMVWAGVVRGLAPLQRVQQAVASRSHRDRSPVVVDPVPGEIRPLVQAINGLLERLDAVLTVQNRFIADAAHQLKTPVAGLQAQLELALREDDPQRMRDSLKNLDAGLERLSRLVSQLLALARNEPDAARNIAMTEVDLNALALESARDLVPEALRKNVDLGFDGLDAPLWVRGDAARLREMLDNLVDNAVRYTRAGGRVTVRVALASQPTVAVSDDGPGIPPGEREHVFERFHRRLGTTTEGTGLGLAIAQEIARMHGGDIDLREDADGIGNTFTVWVPPASGELTQSIHL